MYLIINAKGHAPSENLALKGCQAPSRIWHPCAKFPIRILVPPHGFWHSPRDICIYVPYSLANINRRSLMLVKPLYGIQFFSVVQVRKSPPIRISPAFKLIGNTWAVLDCTLDQLTMPSVPMEFNSAPCKMFCLLVNKMM